jgi:hypothetical protein
MWLIALTTPTFICQCLTGRARRWLWAYGAETNIMESCGRISRMETMSLVGQDYIIHVNSYSQNLQVFRSGVLDMIWGNTSLAPVRCPVGTSNNINMMPVPTWYEPEVIPVSYCDCTNLNITYIIYQCCVIVYLFEFKELIVFIESSKWRSNTNSRLVLNFWKRDEIPKQLFL